MKADEARGLFGVGPTLSLGFARALTHVLEAAWHNQIGSLTDPLRREAEARLGDITTHGVASDLHLMKYWFDPIASGRRLREALDSLPPFALASHVEEEQVLAALSSTGDQLLLHVDDSRILVTPEGRAVLWALRARLDAAMAPDDRDGDLYLTDAVVRVALTMVHDTYREWVQQRVRGVARLLQTETATMRPTVAGLLFVLLVNRNTDPDRRLPAPDDPKESAEISRAITLPALAFARSIAGTDKASPRGLDLYRGWALGEIARRLGSGLHKDRQGIWISPDQEDRARQRLVEAVRDRPPEARLRVPDALHAALDEYDSVRPVLSALGVAHERPANTRKLVEQLIQAATSGSTAKVLP